MNDRSSWPRWTAAILIGIPTLYALSFWPAACLTHFGMLSNDRADYLYGPLLKLASFAPRPIEYRAYMVLFGHSVDRQELSRQLSQIPDEFLTSDFSLGYPDAARRKVLQARRSK